MLETHPRRRDTEEFADFICAAVTRTAHIFWDVQGLANAAITRRLSADGEATKAVTRRNLDTLVPGERASLPRLLAAAGKAYGPMLPGPQGPTGLAPPRPAVH